MKVVAFLNYTGIAYLNHMDSEPDKGDVRWEVRIIACLDLPRIPTVGEHIHVPETCFVQNGGTPREDYCFNPEYVHYSSCMSEGNDIFRVGAVSFIRDKEVGYVPILLIGNMNSTDDEPEYHSTIGSQLQRYGVYEEDEASGEKTRQKEAQIWIDYLIDGRDLLESVGVYVFSPIGEKPQRQPQDIIREFMKS